MPIVLAGILKLVLQPADLVARKAEVAISYGAFLNTLIQFLIIAFVVFMLVRVVSKVQRREAAAPETPVAPTPQETLLREIRDLLAGQGGTPSLLARPPV